MKTKLFCLVLGIISLAAEPVFHTIFDKFENRRRCMNITILKKLILIIIIVLLFDNRTMAQPFDVGLETGIIIMGVNESTNSLGYLNPFYSTGLLFALNHNSILRIKTGVFYSRTILNDPWARLHFIQIPVGGDFFIGKKKKNFVGGGAYLNNMLNSYESDVSFHKYQSGIYGNFGRSFLLSNSLELEFQVMCQLGLTDYYTKVYFGASGYSKEVVAKNASLNLSAVLLFSL